MHCKTLLQAARNIKTNTIAKITRAAAVAAVTAAAMTAASGEARATTVPDSLRAVHAAARDDSARFDALQKLALFFRNYDLDSTRHYLAAMYQMAQGGQHPFRMAQSHQMRAALHTLTGNYDSAETFYHQAIGEYHRMGHVRGVAEAEANLGRAFAAQGDVSQASRLYFRALRIFDSLDLPSEKSRVLTNLGVLYQNDEQYDESLKYFEESLQIKIKQNDKRGMALIYNNMGISHYFKQDFDNVLAYFSRSLAMYRELDDKRGQAMPYFNIGEIYFEEKQDYSKALYYYKKAFDIEQELGDVAAQAATLSKIGVCYLHLDRPEQALRMQEEAIERLRAVGNLRDLHLAQADLSSTHEKIGDYRNALKMLKEAQQTRQKYDNEQTASELAQLREEYESERKSREIEALKSARAIQALELDSQRRGAALQIKLLMALLAAAAATIAGGALHLRRHKRRAAQAIALKNTLLEYKRAVEEKLVEELDIATRHTELPGDAAARARRAIEIDPKPRPQLPDDLRQAIQERDNAAEMTLLMAEDALRRDSASGMRRVTAPLRAAMAHLGDPELDTLLDDLRREAAEGRLDESRETLRKLVERWRRLRGELQEI